MLSQEGQAPRCTWLSVDIEGLVGLKAQFKTPKHDTWGWGGIAGLFGMVLSPKLVRGTFGLRAMPWVWQVGNTDRGFPAGCTGPGECSEHYRWVAQSKAHLRDVQDQGRLSGLGGQRAQSEAYWKDTWCLKR